MLDLLDNKTIYEKVNAIRLGKGWTIYELAKKAGVAPTTIYNWRDRLSSPTLSLLDAVCTAFEISVIDFLLDEDELSHLSEEQKEIVLLWSTLNGEQKKAIKNLMKTI